MKSKRYHFQPLDKLTTKHATMISELTSAIIVAVVVCLALASCHHDGDTQQQVLDYISRSESMLEQDNPDSAFTLLEEALAYSTDRDDRWGMSQALLNMARWHTMMDNLDSAAICLKRGIEIYPEAPDSIRAIFYGELSANSNIGGDMKESIRYARMALPLMDKMGDSEDYATLCGNTGIAYRRLGMNDSAAIFYQQGMEMAMKSNDYDNQAYLGNNMSVLYCETGHYKEALDAANQAIDAATRAGDDEQRLSALAGKGIVLLFDKQPDAAIDLLTSALEQARGTNYTLLKLKLINYLLKSLEESKRADRHTLAMKYLGEGEKIAATLPPSNTGAAGILEAKMLLLIDKGQYRMAMQSIDSLERLMQSQQVIPMHKLLTAKAKCMAGLGNEGEAYRLQVQAAALSDSAHREDIDKQLNQLTSSYQMLEKELQVTRLSQQQARWRTRVAILAAILLALLSLLGWLMVWIRQRQGQARMRETRKWVEGIEQERARFAREIHDGACNDLLAIGLKLRGEHPDLQETTRQVSTLRASLRNMSHEMMPPQFEQGIRLDEALDYYLSHIEGPKVDLHAQGDGWDQIPASTAYQVYRITQEAIGNIITHQQDATVNVNLSPTRIQITSQGTTVESNDSGIGMQSMRNRADSIGATLSTEHTDDTFTLILDFPRR